MDDIQKSSIGFRVSSVFFVVLLMLGVWSGPAAAGRCGRTTLLFLQPKGSVATTTSAKPVLYFFFDGVIFMDGKIEIRSDDSQHIFKINNMRRGINRINWPAGDIKIGKSVHIKLSYGDDCLENMVIMRMENKDLSKIEWIEFIDRGLRDFDPESKTNLYTNKFIGVLIDNDLDEVISMLR